MKRIGISLILVLVVVSLIAVPAFAAGKHGPAGRSHVGQVYLYEKDPVDWTIVEDGAWGKYNYKLSGENEGTEVSGVFNGHGLTPATDYSLIYYPEVAPNPWENGLYGVVVIGNGVANEEGDVHIKGSAIIGNPDEQPEIGDYVGQTGDKIWLVLSSDLNEQDEMNAWNPGEYLFESALINAGE